MDTKRIVIAILLSIAVLIGYPYVLKRVYPEPEVKEGAKTSTADTAVKTGAAGPGQRSTASHDAKNGVLPAKPGKKAEDVKEELTTVDTPLFTAVFTNIGAGVKKWEVKRYKNSQAKDAKAITLSSASALDSTFKTLIAPNDGALKGLSEAVIFKASRTSIVISTAAETAELVFTGRTKDGIRIEKIYRFKGDGYGAQVALNAVNASKTPFSGAVETHMSFSSEASHAESERYHTGPIIQTKDKLLRQGTKEPVKTGSGAIKWLGIENKYFLEAFIPGSGAAIDWKGEALSSDSGRMDVAAPLNLGPGEGASYAFEMFAGPKEYDLLLKYKTGLEEAIEFGWFSFMAKPLLVVLNFFQRYLKNYGIAIIVITVIIKVVFYPLTKHSLKSMKEMQKIQPQMAALKERYKDDKEKQNKEMMELYKRYKINPVSGCLPMVLQIPVFIALYEVLYVAIELRHAPLAFWITDLSAKDPYYVTPVVMGATMFLQQKMTPSTADPMQAKIMLFMPVVFTFMFLSFPSGLVVYWLVNNVLSIGQQYAVQRSSKA